MSAALLVPSENAWAAPPPIAQRRGRVARNAAPQYSRPWRGKQAITLGRAKRKELHEFFVQLKAQADASGKAALGVAPAGQTMLVAMPPAESVPHAIRLWRHDQWNMAQRDKRVLQTQRLQRRPTLVDSKAVNGSNRRFKATLLRLARELDYGSNWGQVGVSLLKGDAEIRKFFALQRTSLAAQNILDFVVTQVTPPSEILQRWQDAAREAFGIDVSPEYLNTVRTVHRVGTASVVPGLSSGPADRSQP